MSRMIASNYAQYDAMEREAPSLAELARADKAKRRQRMQQKRRRMR